MTDVFAQFNNQAGMADWVFDQDGQLVQQYDLYTSILISLWTDSRAPDSFIPPDQSHDPRGWWGDVDGKYGSNIWMFERRAIANRQPMLLEAKDYAQEALQWLLDYNIAQEVNVETFWFKPDVLAFKIGVLKPDLTRESFDWQWAWKEQPPNEPWVYQAPNRQAVNSTIPTVIVPDVVLNLNFILNSSSLNDPNVPIPVTLSKNFVLGQAVLGTSYLK